MVLIVNDIEKTLIYNQKSYDIESAMCIFIATLIVAYRNITHPLPPCCSPFDKARASDC